MSLFDPPTSPGVPPPWIQAEGCQRMGRYLLGPELGRGGMGRVHEAWDAFLGRLVAVKVLHGSDPIHLVRLLREAQAQARLRHPSICQILDAETDAEAGHSFIAMERIQGVPLSDLRMRLEPRALAGILADVASGIQAAHEAGLVHRDLKPANILVEALPDAGWRPVVVDFGLARDLVREDQTLSWALAGTPAFMSPEQGRGEPPSPQDDIFAMGATLHALLTGTLPYEAATLAGLLTQQASRDPEPLHRRFPNVPRDLETITLKCVEAQASRRYDTAVELEADLRRYIAGEPIRARAVRWPERIWRRVVRHQGLVLTAAAALVLVGSSLTWSLQGRRANRLQVELAQRFGMEVQEIENLLRVERMLPAHDMLPAEGQVWARLEALKRMIASLGRGAEGPGYCALGRGYLMLGDHAMALSMLQRSWQVGYRSPELVEALGAAHLERYHQEAALTKFNWSPEAKARLADLRRQYLEPARAYLSQALDPKGASLSRARLAVMEERYTDARRECRQVYERHPWRYEALVLEAKAAAEECRVLGWQGWNLERLRPHLDELEALLDRITLLARSDVSVHRERLNLQSSLAIYESESGRPTLQPFERSRRIFAEALVIAPEDPELWGRWFYTLQREAFLRLSRGEDIEPLVQDGLRQFQAIQSRLGSRFGVSDDTFQWLLGENQWRRGKDPIPALAAALASSSAVGYNRPEILNVQARHEAQRGQDPRPRLAQARSGLNEQDLQVANDFYRDTILGELCHTQAHWEMQCGIDPGKTLEEGNRHLNQALRLKPSCAYAYWHMAQLQALTARHQRMQGRDARHALGAALEAGRKAVAIRPDHFRSHLGLAEAYLAQAEADWAAGRDTQAALKAARDAGIQARRCNATDWRIAWTQARIALCAAQSAGSAARPMLVEADRALAEGLAVKADAPELHVVQAQVDRLRKERLGEASTRGAVEHARKAQALNPRLVAARTLASIPPSEP